MRRGAPDVPLGAPEFLPARWPGVPGGPSSGLLTASRPVAPGAVHLSVGDAWRKQRCWRPMYSRKRPFKCPCKLEINTFMISHNRQNVSPSTASQFCTLGQNTVRSLPTNAMAILISCGIARLHSSWPQHLAAPKAMLLAPSEKDRQTERCIFLKLWDFFFKQEAFQSFLLTPIGMSLFY